MRKKGEKKTAPFLQSIRTPTPPTRARVPRAGYHAYTEVPPPLDLITPRGFLHRDKDLPAVLDGFLGKQ